MSDFSVSAAPFWKRVSTTSVRLFHAYANWLVGISWKRFVVLSVLLMILASVLQQLPPFRWTVSEEMEDPPTTAKRHSSAASRVAKTPPAAATAASTAASERAGAAKEDEDVVISIGSTGVQITSRRLSNAASGATAAAPAPAAPPASDGASSSVHITLPGATREAIREAARAAREAAKQAAQTSREEAEEARRDAEDARRDAEDAQNDARQAVADAQQAIADARRDAADATAEARRSRHIRVVWGGDSLTDLAFLFIVASAIIKTTYKGRIQAEVKAAAATETAESEQLKRQVVEARIAAMQAQVEPHFLFNTLASIDHLIETDPPRASQMQKNLIALLRASMPTMRESHPTAHNLGREMAVIRPYLEILKVRMEDRLQTDIQVPDGLLSADFPSMMIQSLVENAIKHGLEPKAEGGRLTVRAEIVHGQLAVTVADTGLGFGRAATAGTGVGLSNIRERLQLLYGRKAAMTVSENQPSGTVVTLTVPYQAQFREGPAAQEKA